MRLSSRSAVQPFGPSLRPLLAVALCLAGWPAAHADQQLDPALQQVVASAIEHAQCFPDRFDSAVWYKLMEPRLRSRVKDNAERLDILTAVYLSLIHISEPTRQAEISYAVFCLK